MATPNESKVTKRRPGRRRLPPLAPGPAFQFVVANHPDQFKADNTMRHVRSHVMYKHRDYRDERSGGKSVDGERNSTVAGTSRTPSPGTTNSDTTYQRVESSPTPARHRSDTWNGDSQDCVRYNCLLDPVRHLLHRIIMATSTVPPRSAPPFLEESSEFPFWGNTLEVEPLEDLRRQYISSTTFFSHDHNWMQYVCNDRLLFLSHVSVTCVFRDLSDRMIPDSSLTVYAKTRLLGKMTNCLDTNDTTILSILHLLMSEIGGLDEAAFDVHQEGLIRIIYQRGGLSKLPHRVAAFITLILLSFTVLRGRTEPAPLHNAAPRPVPIAPSEYLVPVSPLFSPQGDFSHISGYCSSGTYEIILDMHNLTQAFLAHWSNPNNDFPTPCLHRIHARLLLRPSTVDQVAPDWVYESCRLAALIYCRSILYKSPLAMSAQGIHSQIVGSGTTNTLHTALLHALEHTDGQDSWGPLRGVFLWICIIGGAASWHSGGVDEATSVSPWARKFFALHTLKTLVSVGFEHAPGMVQALRTALHLRNWLDMERGHGL